MAIERLPYEGSVWPNYMPSGISGYVPRIPQSMEQSGWCPRNHSTSQKTIWQVERHYPDDSYDEIRFDNHKGEPPHYFAKRMLTSDQKPTKKQFYEEIAPELAKSLNGLAKKTERSKKD